MSASNFNITITKELILKAQSGDIQSRNKLIELALPQIKKCIRSNKAFDDNLQDAVLRVIKYLHKFDVNKGCFMRWVSVLSKNISYKAYQKRQDNPEQAFSLFPFEDVQEIFERKYLVQPEEVKEQDNTIEKIMDIVNTSLGPSQQEIFCSIAFEGLQHNEVAEYLNISEGTSKSQYYRAKARIKTLLNQ